MTRFDIWFERLMRTEGGVSDRPLSEDPGGLTNLGITHKTYDAWRASKGEPLRSVREITRDEAAAIAREEYWDAVRADQLPVGVDVVVADYAFNSGPGRAAEDLQRVLGITADGIVGAQTIAAAKLMKPRDIIIGVSDRRLAYMKTLTNWAKNGGWPKRVNRVMLEALADIGEVPPTAAPIDAPLPQERTDKARPQDVSVLRETIRDPAAITALGGILTSLIAGLSTISDGPIAYALAFAVAAGTAAAIWRLVVKRVRQ